MDGESSEGAEVGRGADAGADGAEGADGERERGPGGEPNLGSMVLVKGMRSPAPMPLNDLYVHTAKLTPHNTVCFVCDSHSLKASLQPMVT